MLNVTEAAGEYLVQLLDKAEAPTDTAVRLVVEGRQLTMTLDKPNPEDATFDHEGRTVLLVDGVLSSALAERTLDVKAGEDREQLALV